MSRDRDMTEIPDAWVEKAAQTMHEVEETWGARLPHSETRMRVRAVLAAVLPLVRRAPVVDREALAEALWSDQNDDPDLLWENVYTDEYHRRADNLIAEMDWQDAADVRRAERERVAEEIAAAIADQVGSTSYRDAAFRQAVRIAREVGGRDE